MQPRQSPPEITAKQSQPPLGLEMAKFVAVNPA